jgi:hypothetical protein
MGNLDYIQVLGTSGSEDVPMYSTRLHRIQVRQIHAALHKELHGRLAARSYFRIFSPGHCSHATV